MAPVREFILVVVVSAQLVDYFDSANNVITGVSLIEVMRATESAFHSTVLICGNLGSNSTS